MGIRFSEGRKPEVATHDTEAKVPEHIFGRRALVRQQSLIPLICASLLLAFLVPNSMLFERGFGDDNSVFAYIGWLMRQGYVPYRDVWDHKGPLLYAVNWAGWVITPGATIGIGLLQVLTYAFAFLLLAIMLRRIVGPWTIALLALFSLSFVAECSNGGNVTESWALAPSALALYLAFEVPSDHLRWRHAILVATAASIAFWLRPDLSLIPVAALATMAATLDKEGAIGQASTFIVIGAGTVVLESGLVLLVFWRFGALSQLWAEYFIYNRNYIETISTVARISDLAGLVIFVLTRQPLFIVGAIGWAVLGCDTWYGRWDPHMSGAARLMIVVLFPLVFASCLTSGRAYPHYLLTLWPVLTIVGGGVVEHMIRFGAGAFAGPSQEKKIGFAVAGILLLVHQVGLIAHAAVIELRRANEAVAVAKYIDAITTPEDHVVSVGAEVAVQIALYARRLPATSYIYQAPLVHRANPLRHAERALFLKKVDAEQPRVIFSMPSVVGSLCQSAILDADPEQGAAAYGYSIGTIPRALGPILSRHYALVNGFTTACVYVRRTLSSP